LLVTAPVSMFVHALTVPSRQYLRRVEALLTKKNQEKKFEGLSGLDTEKEGQS
jgi:hypothetical protein